MSAPIIIKYEDRQVGDVIVVQTAEYRPTPPGWTCLSTYPGTLAYRVETSVCDRDARDDWGGVPLLALAIRVTTEAPTGMPTITPVALQPETLQPIIIPLRPA